MSKLQAPKAREERGSLDVKQLREAVDQFICAYNAKAAPFE
jgi:hypothetical protein